MATPGLIRGKLAEKAPSSPFCERMAATEQGREFHNCGAATEKAIHLVPASRISLGGETTRNASPADVSTWQGQYQHRQSFR